MQKANPVLYRQNSTKIYFKHKFSVIQPCNLNFQHFPQLYSSLCDIIEILNSTFTGQLVFVVISILVIDIFAFYGVIREFLSNQNLKFIIIGNSTWLVLQSAIKFFMAHCGSSTTSEAEKSLIIVSQFMDQVDDTDMMTRINLNLVMNQMRFRNKNLENKFFAINYKLILAVSYN